MKIARIEVPDCEGCPYVDLRPPATCTETEDQREIQDTAEIPEFCPLPDAPEAKNG